MEAVISAWYVASVDEREEHEIAELTAAVERQDAAMQAARRYAAAEIARADKIRMEQEERAEKAHQVLANRQLEKAQRAHRAFASAAKISEQYPIIPNPVADPIDPAHP